MFRIHSRVRQFAALILGILIITAAALPLPAVQAAAPVTDPTGDAIARAVAWMKTQQLADGSFGYKGDSSASMTADVVYALAVVGEQPDGPAWTQPGGHSALDALEALAPGYVGSDAGQAGKVARAVTLSGGNPRSFGGLNLISIIQAAYNPATGRYHKDYLFRHTLAVEALYRAGETVPVAAITALRQAQVSDGGWFWSFNQRAGEAQSDVDTTGRVLQLLGGVLNVRSSCAYRNAGRYLATQQLATGGWNVGYMTGPANANSTALTVGGLSAAGIDPQGAVYRKNNQGARDTLLAFQEPSGAFVYTLDPQVGPEVRLMATAEALVALSQPLQPAGDACDPVIYLPLILR